MHVGEVDEPVGRLAFAEAETPRSDPCRFHAPWRPPPPVAALTSNAAIRKRRRLNMRALTSRFPVLTDAVGILTRWRKVERLPRVSPFRGLSFSSAAKRAAVSGRCATLPRLARTRNPRRRPAHSRRTHPCGIRRFAFRQSNHPGAAALHLILPSHEPRLREPLAQFGDDLRRWRQFGQQRSLRAWRVCRHGLQSVRPAGRAARLCRP